MRSLISRAQSNSHHRNTMPGGKLFVSKSVKETASCTALDIGETVKLAIGIAVDIAKEKKS
jgi:hypothetical protein